MHASIENKTYKFRYFSFEDVISYPTVKHLYVYLLVCYCYWDVNAKRGREELSR